MLLRVCLDDTSPKREFAGAARGAFRAGAPDMQSGGGLTPRRVRVACVGDSLTVGDNQYGADGRPLWAPERCKATSLCHGSYPAVLQALLGARDYDVQEFAAYSVSISSVLSACPLNRSSGTRARERIDHSCAAENAHLSRIPLVLDLAAFKPAMVVMMLGTNDALHSTVRNETNVARTVESQMSLLLRALLHTMAGELPLVLVMQPPPTMAEMPRVGCSEPTPPPQHAKLGVYIRPSGSTCSCAAMHTCHYNPAGCRHFYRCLTCLPNETVYMRPDSNVTVSRAGCVRGDAIGHVRLGVKRATESAADAWSTAAVFAGNDSTHCAAGLHAARPIPIAADWQMFSDPYHLRPAGSAAIACHVHASLMGHCGAMREDRKMRDRHAQVCEVVMRVASQPSRAGLQQHLDHALNVQLRHLLPTGTAVTAPFNMIQPTV